MPGTAQNITEHAARLHVGDGDTCPLRAGAVGFQLARQHDTHPAVGCTRQHKGFALAVAAHSGTQLREQCLQLFSGQAGK